MLLFSWFLKFLCKLRLFRDYSWVDKCDFHDFSKFIISVFGNENWLVRGVLERIFTWRMHRYHHFFHTTRRLEMVWLWVFAFCGNLAHEFLRIKILWHIMIATCFPNSFQCLLSQPYQLDWMIRKMFTLCWCGL